MITRSAGWLLGQRGSNETCNISLVICLRDFTLLSLPPTNILKNRPMRFQKSNNRVHPFRTIHMLLVLKPPHSICSHNALLDPVLIKQTTLFPHFIYIRPILNFNCFYLKTSTENGDDIGMNEEEGGARNKTRHRPHGDIRESHWYW